LRKYTDPPAPDDVVVVGVEEPHAVKPTRRLPAARATTILRLLNLISMLLSSMKGVST